MNSIIHLSDFHINPSMPEPGEHKIFSSLIKEIKSQNLENLILVYTGDIIDSGPKQFNPPANITKQEKKDLWNSYALSAYEHAAKYFNYLTSELGIDNKHVIIAIGNHDVNQNDNETLSFECPIKDHKDIQYGKGRFDAVSNFFKSLQYQFSDVGNHFREIDGFNFVVANTQWVDKEDSQIEKLCLNCNTLTNVFEANKNRLLNTKEGAGKLHNIFVAHNPERDCCEYSSYPYKENDYVFLEKKIREYCGIKLFGDKHTTDKKNHDYIAGAPFYHDRISYGIHIFNDYGRYSHKTINYNKDKNDWYVKQDMESVKKILQCSNDNLKYEAFKYLKLDNSYIDLVVDKVYNFNAIKMSDPWNNLDDLFSSFVSIRIPSNDGTGIPYNYLGIFNTVTDFIKKTDNNICLTIKGNAATGKSVFLTLLYLNLLYEYSDDQLSYIPFYINIESIIDKTISSKANNEHRVETAFCIDNKEFFEDIKSIVEKQFKKAEEISNDYNRKIVFLIDGIKQFAYYDNFNIEETVDLLLTNYLNKGVIHTAIVSINIDNDLNLDYTNFAKKDDSEYVAYFNSINVTKVSTNNKLVNFVKAYCMLNDYGEDAVDDVIECIERLRIPYVDVGLMSIAITKLVSKTTSPIFNIIYDYYFGIQAVTNDQRQFYANVCYALYYEKRNYTSIKHNEPRLGYTAFNKIIRHKLLSKILIAIHYCNQITKKRTQGAADNTLPQGTLLILNRLYDNELCCFIIGYLKLNNSAAKLIAFEDRYYKQLDFSGKSTITYLIGRIIDNKEELRYILKNEESKLDKAPKPKIKDSRRYYEYCVAKRSIIISRLANDLESFLSPGNYFDQLLSDDNQRRVNRKFYLEFYGDRKKNQVVPERDVILPGLDFYNTYQLLATKIRKAISKKSHNRLLELELFTLCDLIQVHLDYPQITDRLLANGVIEYCERDYERPASLFYNERYTSKDSQAATSVLELMDEQIKQYLEDVTPQNNARKYKQYLHVRQDQFQMALHSLEDGKRIATYNVNDLLNNLAALSDVKKTGWLINDTDKKNDDQMSKIFNSEICYETTLEHVYECYLIGLLYLPNKAPDVKKYNKDKILKMLLIHDLGEAYIKDYPPTYENYEKTRKEEHKQCVRIFLSGMHEKTANMTEYLELWNEWHAHDEYKSSTNINICIASEIDKIQMIYKLFKLLSEEKLDLSEARVQNFYDSSRLITSSVGINIFNTLIANNTAFKKVADKKNISLKEKIWNSQQ